MQEKVGGCWRFGLFFFLREVVCAEGSSSTSAGVGVRAEVVDSAIWTSVSAAAVIVADGSCAVGTADCSFSFVPLMLPLLWLWLPPLPSPSSPFLQQTLHQPAVHPDILFRLDQTIAQLNCQRSRPFHLTLQSTWQRFHCRYRPSWR